MRHKPNKPCLIGLFLSFRNFAFLSVWIWTWDNPRTTVVKWQDLDLVDSICQILCRVYAKANKGIFPVNFPMNWASHFRFEKLWQTFEKNILLTTHERQYMSDFCYNFLAVKAFSKFLPFYNCFKLDLNYLRVGKFFCRSLFSSVNSVNFFKGKVASYYGSPGNFVWLWTSEFLAKHFFSHI